jgi:polyribonucleotide nucleotidyltransferase
MDLKIPGIPIDLIERILVQADEARMKIHSIMEETLSVPRPDLSAYAPRIVSMKVDKDKIREIIGPGGKVIRGIIEETGAIIDIDDEGEVRIASPDGGSRDKAVEMINAIIEDPEVGKVYKGVVKRIVDFGAFVEILPGKEGLLHISEIENHRIDRVRDVLDEGQEIEVKVVESDREDKIRLSRRVLLPGAEDDSRRSRPGGGRDRSSRPRSGRDRSRRDRGGRDRSGRDRGGRDRGGRDR